MDPPTLTRVHRCSSYCKCQGNLIIRRRSTPEREDVGDTGRENTPEVIGFRLRLGFFFDPRRSMVMKIL